MTLENVLLVAAGTLTALLAGVFFAYSTSVNGALARLKDVEYVRAMQALIIVIQNPLFFLSFMGPIVLLPIVTFMSHGENSTRFMLLLIATIVYIAGSFMVTMAGNVPLNDRLASVNADGASSEVTRARTAFEKPWNRLHTLRTIASIIATILIFAACLVDN